MRKRKLSLSRLAIHDFGRSLRVWKKEIQPGEIITALVNERNKALVSGLKALGLATVLMLWLAANKPDLSLRLALVDVSVPTSYVAFTMAVCLFGFLISIINYAVLDQFIDVASERLFRFDASWMITILKDGSGAWASGLVQQFRFFKSGKAHLRFAIGTIFFALLPLLLVLGVIYWTLLKSGAAVLANEGIFSLAATVTIAGWALAIFPIIYAVFIVTPFEFSKNTKFIRWNFLNRLYKRLGLQHPRVGSWLHDQNG